MAKAVKCDRCGRFFEYYSVKAWNSEATTRGFHTVVQGSYTDHDDYFHKKNIRALYRLMQRVQRMA